MARVIIVPGLAVRSYAEPAAQSLAPHDVELLPAPTWRGVPDHVDTYGRWGLAARVRRSAAPVDLMIGLSLGTQAAAVAATECDVRTLLLVSPTIEPANRSRGRLLRTWLHGDRHPTRSRWVSRSRTGRVPVHGGCTEAWCPRSASRWRTSSPRSRLGW